jgi:hypothetical protein
VHQLEILPLESQRRSSARVLIQQHEQLPHHRPCVLLQGREGWEAEEGREAAQGEGGDAQMLGLQPVRQEGNERVEELQVLLVVLVKVVLFFEQEMQHLEHRRTEVMLNQYYMVA